MSSFIKMISEWKKQKTSWVQSHTLSGKYTFKPFVELGSMILFCWKSTSGWVYLHIKILKAFISRKSWNKVFCCSYDPQSSALLGESDWWDGNNHAKGLQIWWWWWWFVILQAWKTVLGFFIIAYVSVWCTLFLCVGHFPLKSVHLIRLLLTSFFFFCLQEFKTDPEVPERMGADAAGEAVQEFLKQATGGQQRAEHGVHVQTELLQDGLRLQIWGLHVQAHSTHQSSSGEFREIFMNTKRLQIFTPWVQILQEVSTNTLICWTFSFCGDFFCKFQIKIQLLKEYHYCRYSTFILIWSEKIKQKINLLHVATHPSNGFHCQQDCTW